MANQSKKHRKFVATSVTAALVATAVAPAAGFAAEKPNFKDVPSWAKDSVDYLVAKGAIKGLPDGTFGPTLEMTRAEVATIFALTLEGIKVDDNAKSKFADANGHWAEKYIAAIESKGIIKGNEKGQFDPNGKIDRQSLATMVVAAYDLKLNEKADVSFPDNTSWGKDAINILASLGILAGTDGKANPTAKITRAEVPAFVHRAEVKEVRVPVKEKEDEAVKVESVSAINAKTLEVKFNTAVDTDKAKIEVKRDTVKPSVKEVKFSEDKKSATVEFNANMLAGDYTVSVTGLSEKALTGSVKVEAEKLTAIEFLSDVAVIATNDITLNVQAKNQYGEIINDKLATSNTNISVTASKGTSGHTIDKDGVLVVKGNAGDFKADDKVVVTIVDSATGVTATKTVTVAKAAQVESIQLGELTTADEELAKKPVNVANMGADFAKYYIPVTIKDQYGNTLKAADLAGVNVLSSNEKIVKVASSQIVDLPKVGTVIKLQAPDATATHGTAVLTVVSAGTGKTASVSVKVLENAKTDVLTVSAPEATLKQNVKTELPFTAADQYGNALVSSSELVKDGGASSATVLKFTDGSSITATGADLDYSVDYGNKNKVKLHVTPTSKNVVLTAVSATGKAQTLNLTAEAAPEAATLGGLSKDLYSAIQKGQTQAINLTDVIVKDQYGEDIALPAGFNVTFAAVDGTLDTVSLSATTLNSGTTSTTATAATKGTEAIQLSLVDTTNSNKVLDTVTVNLETVELKDITSFGFEEVGNLYTGTSFKYGNLTADYNKALTIFGKKGSTEVKVDQSLLKSTTISAPLTTTTVTSLVQASNQTVTNGEAKTATLTGVIAGANDPITVTQTVTYSDAKSVINDVTVRKTSGAKATITDGAVVVPVASIDGKKIGPVGADSTFQFYAKDQYGVAAKELSYTVTNLKSSNANVTGVSIANNGTITVAETTTTSGLAAGDTFTITAIVDGVVKSIKVIVGA